MLEFPNISMKETRYYQDAVAEGEAAMLLRQMERTTARCPNLPANALPAPMRKPCWSGVSASSMPIAWMRFGGIEGFAEMFKANGWTQPEAARHRGVIQPRMNDLLRGRMSRFSLDALVNIFTAIGQRVHIQLEAA